MIYLADGVVAGERSLQSFVPISLGVPTLTVDTSDGYQPGCPGGLSMPLRFVRPGGWWAGDGLVLWCGFR
ncbi:hypothetical protein ACIG36_13925, partial [Streptomyces sp. NPDC053048]